MNIVFSGLNVSVLAYENSSDQYSGGIDNPYVGTEHAYDSMAELEAEEAERKYRENADIEANKVLFYVIADDNGSYLSDSSDICRKYELHNISMIYESGNDAGEVFYEAETSSDDVWGLVEKLRDDECIASAEPAFVWKKSALGEPVEVAESEFNRASHFSLLHTENVWKSLKNSSAPGKGVVIAVIDTGVDYNHKDLADNMWTNPNEIPDNGIDDDGNGYVDDVHGVNIIYNSGDPMDDHGHGTHVAGAIAMAAGNGGGVGLAYGAKIMCIKAGSSSGTFASYDVAKAIKYAVDNGADVINMSFGGEEKSTVVEAALNDAAEYAVLVASAGNDGLPTSEAVANGYKNCKDVYPAGFNTVIGVMASDNEDHLAAFSNWDYISGKGCEYEMAAPGVDIYSTLPDNRYAVWSGTSLASANVAAAAAIIRSEYPNKSKYDARFIMGQLINASSSKAIAEPAVVTTPEVTTVTITAANPVTTVSTTTVMSDDPLVNADVDGKEGIDKDDFAYLLKGLVGLYDLGGSKGDVNCDGTADMFDAVSVLRLCDNKDSVKDIMDSATIRKEYISFDIPSIDITADGDYTNYTITYNSSYPFKAITGQLKYNGKAYSGEFKEVKLLDATSDDIIYEFNPENGKIAAYCAGNETSGSFTISVYEGKDGSYSIDTSSLKFYDENGKEYLGYYLGMFDPELNYHSASSTAAVGTPSAVAVYDKKIEYPRLNIMDSLTVKAHPELRMEAVEMHETADIDEANNGDGIVQPGETVGLGISIWNSWAAASDVKVKIEAVGADGKANPYVEVLDSNISMGDIKAYSGADNGLTYSNGKIKSITAPIRIKVKDNAPNDGKMEFKITLTAKNAFDTDDMAVYTSDSDYSFIVQNIQYLHGKIKKDITLDRSRFWIIDGDVYLLNGAVMTIKPGAQIQFGYEGSTESSSSLNDVLICKGTEQDPIVLFKGKGYDGSASISASKAIYTKFVSVKPSVNICDHCFLYFDSTDNRTDMLYVQKLTNSILNISNNLMQRGSISMFIPFAQNCIFEGIPLFDNIGRSLNSCVFLGNINDFSPLGNSYYTDNNYSNNAILNNYNDPEHVGTNTYIFKEETLGLLMRSYGFSSSSEADAYVADYLEYLRESRNYYGTDDPQLIGIPDDTEEYFPEVYESFLTLDSPEIESIYPFMTEAYVTNEKGERIENAYPGQTLMVHVKFNRDMATDVQPDVTVGINWGDSEVFGPFTNCYESYREYTALGNWITSKEWVGQFSLISLSDARFVSDFFDDVRKSTDHSQIELPNVDDILYIRSEGAVAADDRWLVTGNDGGRFSFNVKKPAVIQNDDTASSKLKGKGGAGCNQLTWVQDEMDTLAGYNIYRSVGDNNYFTKLNKSLLSNEDLQYTDTDVITGQKYYYYFTSVDTDFNETRPSNMVECIPLDSEKPQITHTPVTYSKPEQAISINANVTDNVKVDSVKLFYKYSDEAEWNSDKMRNTSGSSYQKIFSAYEVRNGQLQYYIEATDGINTANVGNKDKPCVIDINPDGSTTTTTITSATTTAPVGTTATISSAVVSCTVTTAAGTTTTNNSPASVTATTSTMSATSQNSCITTTTSAVSKTTSSTTSTSKSVAATTDTTVYGPLPLTTTTVPVTTTTTNKTGVTVSSATTTTATTTTTINNGPQTFTTTSISETTSTTSVSGENVYTTSTTGAGTTTTINGPMPFTTTTTMPVSSTSTSTVNVSTTTTTNSINAPKIRNLIVSDPKANERIIFNADITGNSYIDAVLYYKYAEDTEWNIVSMRKTEGSTYRGVISAYESRQGTLQYYLEVSDGINTSYYGSAEKCFKIQVSAATTITTTKLSTTTTSKKNITTTSTPNTSTTNSTTSLTTTITFTNLSTSQTTTSVITTTTSGTSTTGTTTSTTSRLINTSTTTSNNTSNSTTSTTTKPVSTSTVTQVTKASVTVNINDISTDSPVEVKSEDIKAVFNTDAVKDIMKQVESGVIELKYEIIEETSEIATLELKEAVEETIRSGGTVVNLTLTDSQQNEIQLAEGAGSISITIPYIASRSNATIKIYSLDKNGNKQEIEGVYDANTHSLTFEITKFAIYSIEEVSSESADYKLGDVDNNGKINAVDASMVLTYYANISTNKDGGLDEKQKLAANADKNDVINAVDASHILSYYAYTSTTKTDIKSFEDYMNNN